MNTHKLVKLANGEELELTAADIRCIRSAIVHANKRCHEQAKRARTQGAACLMEAGEFYALFEKLNKITQP